jgi:CRISPR-associated protein Cmr2
LIEEAIADNVKQHKHYQGLLATKKRMGPATHVGLNRALLDFSNRLVPYITEKRCCGRVIYSGGDDVLAVLPLEDLALFLRSLRACWSGEKDPLGEFKGGEGEGGYWTPTEKVSQEDLVRRPYFTMGEGATMSLGIVIAHKSIPLPTVLETLWEAEKERAKKLPKAGNSSQLDFIPPKDGLCFRVIYSSGNVLEALMKGYLLEDWCEILENQQKKEFSPLLYRLAEELPQRCAVTANTHLFREAAKVILSRREDSKKLEEEQRENLLKWLDKWENWAYRANPKQERDKPILGTQPQDIGYLLRLTAFLVDRLEEREQWGQEEIR